MSETTTVTIKSLEKNDSGWYELRDGNDTLYSTKKEEVVSPARGLIDKQALLTFTVKTNEKNGRTYTNRYLDAVEAVSSGNGDTPPLGTGDYVTGQKPPIEARRIFASVAWNNAAKFVELELKHGSEQQVDATTVMALATKFANGIFNDLIRRGNAYLPDEDIPFDGGP